MYKILFKLRNKKKQDDWLNRIKAKYQVKPIKEMLLGSLKNSLNAFGVDQKFESFCNAIFAKSCQTFDCNIVILAH